MSNLIIAGLALALLLPAVPAGAVRVTCIGDSITEGALPFDEEDIGGYPRRLQRLLRRGGLEGTDVVNAGIGGENTFDMRARFRSDLEDAEIVIVLGGTNDVGDVVGGRLTYEDVLDNLETMIDAGRGLGIRSILGTVVPRKPGATIDSSNRGTYELVLRIRELAHKRRFELVDFWDAFPSGALSTYALFYYQGPDRTGHPNAAGFQRMAEVAASVVLDGDAQRPVEGRVFQPERGAEVDRRTEYELELFDFDPGIQLSTATVVLNGEPLETTVTGNRRKARLLAKADRKRRCKVLFSVRASDRAEPPNELELLLRRHESPDGDPLRGDGNGDCRVDGRDLARFGATFGKSETDLGFDQDYDFVADGEIDGEDFARLAANFGRTAPEV